MDASAFSVAPAPAAATPPVAASGSRRWPARAANVLLWASVALALAVAIAAAFGIRTAVILTGSMRPHLSPNDMILTQRIDAREARPGDIISFAAPDQHGVVITHRVRHVSATRDGRLAFETRGDANNTSEHWKIAPTGTVARVVGVLPGLGALTDWTGHPTTRIIIFTLLGVLLLGLGLRWVWSER